MLGMLVSIRKVKYKLLGVFLFVFFNIIYLYHNDIHYVLYEHLQKAMLPGLSSDPAAGVDSHHSSHPTSQATASTTVTIAAYPPAYTNAPHDDEECEAYYGPQYLEYIASNHVPYCEGGSRSSFECFRTHLNQSACLATSVLIDPSRVELKNATAMHCQLRNFTAEAMENPSGAADFYGILNVEDMQSGFYDTGVKEQLKHWDVNLSEEGCDPEGDGKWTLLVKPEGNDNVWHKLMELWQSVITLDALQMAIDSRTGKPYLRPEDITDMQVVFTHGGMPDGIDNWWGMVTGKKPVLQSEMAPTCLGKVILPLEGSSSPFWAWHWEKRDCHNKFLLDTFLGRIHRHIGLAPQKHDHETDQAVVTIIDRKKTRKIKDLESLVQSSRERWPAVKFQVVDFATIPLDSQVALVRNTDVLIGATGAGLTHILWLEEESSVVEIQSNSKSGPYAGFRNLSKMRNLRYFMAHRDHCEGNDAGDWQLSEWLVIKEEVWTALVDAAIMAQFHKGKKIGEVVAPGNYTPSSDV